MLKVFIWLRTLAALIGCFWLVVTFTPVVEWWARALARPWGSGEGDVLIVLGGDGMGDGLLGPSSYLRAVYTVRAMRAHRFQQVIISGGNSNRMNPPLAEVMRDFVRGHGIDTSNVVLETESTSTRENALRSVELLRSSGNTTGKVVLLTSDFHVWRATRVFQKAGLAVDSWPIPDILKRRGAWQARAGLVVELATETAKIGWYRWKGWI